MEIKREPYENTTSYKFLIPVLYFKNVQKFEKKIYKAIYFKF
jgi:hypothetical protein